MQVQVSRSTLPKAKGLSPPLSGPTLPLPKSRGFGEGGRRPGGGGAPLRPDRAAGRKFTIHSTGLAGASPLSFCSMVITSPMQNCDPLYDLWHFLI
jgi:hypothetical protein